jgi:2-oxoglutarate dehydrogenase E2 component (dihydrolipoamide succinyltransferase)
MSKIEIIVPSLGESITEATVATWYKKVGDLVAKDEVLLELETDKITLEVSALEAGQLSEIKADQGSAVAMGQILGLLDSSIQPEEKKSSLEEKNPIAVEKPYPSPGAAVLMETNQIKPEMVKGSGPDGRIRKEDLDKVLKASLTMKSEKPINAGQERRVKMTRLRQTIGQRLKSVQNTAAILTTFNEVDMFEIMKIRQTYQEAFQKKEGIKLGFMSFFVKAVVMALKSFPIINSEVSGDEIIYKDFFHIGVAVGTDSGLVVPVLREADQLSLAEIEKAIAELGKKAKEGKLTMSDLTGGTFTITNGGTYGSLLSTPIINPPQSAILGMHNIVQRPMGLPSGEIALRPMIYLALSYDHRIIDGKEAVQFLVRVKELLENPIRFLLEI